MKGIVIPTVFGALGAVPNYWKVEWNIWKSGEESRVHRQGY